MTTVLSRPEPATTAPVAEATDPAPYLWTRAKYEEAVKAGLFTTDDKIELIEGEIVQKMPQNDPHRTALGAMQEALGRAFPTGHWVCIQMPLSVGRRSKPEPDLAVVVGSWRDYRSAAPTAEATVLLVEVSDTTLRYDQTRKAALYAHAGIGDYWIVNLPEQVLEARRVPVDGVYTQTLRLAPGEAVAPLAAPDAPLAIGDLLP